MTAIAVTLFTLAALLVAAVVALEWRDSRRQAREAAAVKARGPEPWRNVRVTDRRAS